MGRGRGDVPNRRLMNWYRGDEEWCVPLENRSRGVGDKKPDRLIWAGKVVARRRVMWKGRKLEERCTNIIYVEIVIDNL